MYEREHYAAVGRIIEKADKYPDKVITAKLLGAVAIDDFELDIASRTMNLRSFELWNATNEAIRLDNQPMLALLYISSVVGITRSKASYFEHIANSHHGQFLVPKKAEEAELMQQEYVAILNIIKHATIDKTD